MPAERGQIFITSGSSHLNIRGVTQHKSIRGMVKTGKISTRSPSKVVFLGLGLGLDLRIRPGLGSGLKFRVISRVKVLFRVRARFLVLIQ